MFRVDLHTHSVESPDGGLSSQEYGSALNTCKLDCIAITDHNTTEFALELHSTFGDRIIVGEEILTAQGEIIGLYLEETIPAGLDPVETIAAIRAQLGLVYIPHPFETKRKGMSRETLEAVRNDVDIIESYNGRAWAQQRSHEAQTWATEHSKAMAASSDAHGWYGWGATHTVLAAMPTRETLVSLLSNAQQVTHAPSLRGALYPTLNRMKKRWWHA